jgi:hypothetical protein
VVEILAHAAGTVAMNKYSYCFAMGSSHGIACRTLRTWHLDLIAE